MIPGMVTATATSLRANLFRLLDGVAQGEEVEVIHKGTTLRITAANRGSRLSRLIVREPATDLPEILSGWDPAAQSEWEREQKDLLQD